MRRAPERCRVRLWKFFQDEWKGICRARHRVKRPGPAYGSVLLGDPPSFDEDDANPHCCVQPRRCSCRAVACGDRGVSCDMGRRPLVRRRWRRGSPFPARQGMPPLAPRPPRSPRQSRLRSRTLLGPVVPRERSEGPTRPPHCRVRMSLTADPMPAWRIRLDSPPSPEMWQRGQSVPAGASTRNIPECATIPERHLGVISRKLRLPRPCRTSTGRLSSSLSGVSSRPRGRRATNGRRQNTPGTKAAPEQNA